MHSSVLLKGIFSLLDYLDDYLIYWSVSTSVIDNNCILWQICCALLCIHILHNFPHKGKGFPDNGTRLLLKQLWSTFKLPIFLLVDADPHGIEIMAVYKYGSKVQHLFVMFSYPLQPRQEKQHNLWTAHPAVGAPLSVHISD